MVPYGIGRARWAVRCLVYGGVFRACKACSIVKARSVDLHFSCGGVCSHSQYNSDVVVYVASCFIRTEHNQLIFMCWACCKGILRCPLIMAVNDVCKVHDCQHTIGESMLGDGPC